MKAFVRFGSVAFSCAVLAVWGVASCSDSSSSGGGGGGNSEAGGESTEGGGKPTGQVGEKKTVAVTAADGGEVAVAGAALTIPAGALAADTDITVETVEASGLPSPSSIVASVFEFGPAGLQFEEPAELRLDYDASAVPEGSTVSISVLEDGAWSPVAGSAVAGGKVVGSISHFSVYTVTFTASGSTGSASCESLNFSPCGGAIEGVWEYSLGCAEGLDLGAGKLFEACAEAVVEVGIDLSGSATFGADGSFSATQAIGFTSIVTVPMSCLPTGATCEKMGEGTGYTAVSSANGCTLTTEVQQPSKDSSGSYTVDGSTLVVTDDDDDDPDQMDFCVSGNTLTVRQVDSEKGTTILYQATRK